MITKMIPADLLLNKTAQYTFIRKYKNSIITSWIDHVLVSNVNRIKYLNIMQQLNTNTSDHMPISIQYKLELYDCQTRVKEINWLDRLQREYYWNMIINNC